MAPHVASVRIRWSDLDPLGHVNNVRMLELVQDARVQMLAGLGIFEQHGHAGDSGNPGHAGVSGRALTQVVANLQITYRRPLLLGGDASVETAVSHLGRTSYTLGFRILDADGREVAEGSTVLVVVDPATGRAEPMPEALVAALQGFSAE